MFAAASDQVSATTGQKHQGRTTADQRPADHSPLTPFSLPGTQAADPRYAMLRVPVIDAENAPLMAKTVWQGVVTKDTPTRTTLLNTIKIQHSLGQLSAERAQWLAEHKDAPLLMWSAVENSFELADPTGNLNHATISAYAARLPMRQITRFALNWLAEAPQLVDAALVDHLIAFKRHLADSQRNHVDIAAYETAIKATLENIAHHLNQLIAKPTPAHEDNPYSAFGVNALYQENGGLVFAVNEMMGIDLALCTDTLPNATWEAIKLAIDLIAKHLQPLDTPLGIQEYRACFELEEVEDDMADIATYLCNNDLDAENPDHVEEAIENLGGYTMVDCYGTWQHYADMIADGEEIGGRWDQAHTVELDTLKTMAGQLATPKDNQDEQAQAWLNTALATLTNVIDTHTLSDFNSLLPELNSMDSHMAQPVYLGEEDQISEFLQMIFEHRMNGEEPDEQVIEWNTTPRDLIEQAQRFGYGIDLLVKLGAIGAENTPETD